MKHILVPTHFTQATLKAIQYIIRLFPHNVCDITLLHIIKIPDSITELLLMPREEERLESMDNSFSKALERLKKKYAVEINDVHVVHAYGDMHAGIENYLANHQVSMILCPEEETTGTLEQVRGLLDKTGLPVLYFPSGCETERPKKVAFFHEKQLYSNTSDDLVEVFYEMAKRYQTQLLVLSVIEPKSNIDVGAIIDSFRQRNEKYPEIGCSFHFMSGDGSMQGVSNFLHEFNVDMIVIRKKKKHFFQLFSNNPMEGIARQSRIPFLAIK